jgi:hypothetical protein
MSASPRNTRSIVIGTLLALISASCLVAFALLAGSADYPSGPPLAAVKPADSAPPVKLTARSKENSDRPQVRPGRKNDPTAPIVLGIRVTDPEPRDDDRDGRKGRDRDRRRDGYSRGSKGSRDSKDGSGDKNLDGRGSTPGIAKPTTEPPTLSDDDGPNPPGHAYGLHKKEGSGAKGASSSSPTGGPPAHAQANGHSGSSSSGSGSSHGPPAHAQANGHGKGPKS